MGQAAPETPQPDPNTFLDRSSLAAMGLSALGIVLRADGSHEYAWHCVPFSEAAQYGLEVFYPYDNELRVSTKDGRLAFDGDFGPAMVEANEAYIFGEDTPYFDRQFSSLEEFKEWGAEDK